MKLLLFEELGGVTFFIETQVRENCNAVFETREIALFLFPLDTASKKKKKRKENGPTYLGEMNLCRALSFFFSGVDFCC